MDALSSRVGRALGGEAPSSLAGLEEAVRDALDGGGLDGPTARLFIRAAHFARRTAADAMVPRVQVATLGVEATLNDLLELAATSGHARFLVFGDDPDDILGLATLRDACRAMEGGARREEAVRTIVRPAPVVPETAPLPSVLGHLGGDAPGLALVVDEYGGTAGALTMHDVLEEVAGEIDALQGQVRALSPPRRGWLVPGGLHRDALADEVGLLLPEGSYDTVAGYLMERLGRLPAAGDQVAAGPWALQVHEVEGARVATVLAVPAAVVGEVRSRPGSRVRRPAGQLAALLRRARRWPAIDDGEARMLASALRLAGLDARGVMRDRSHVVAVPHQASREDVEAAWLGSGHARLPVYESSLDRVLGYVRAVELYRPGGPPWRGQIPRHLIHPVLRVRRSRRLVDVLEDMRRSGSSFGVVTGPGGVTLGILTLEDVLTQLLIGQDVLAAPRAEAAGLRLQRQGSSEDGRAG
jgi:CBS domain containing-hemolysin-like protein